MNVIIDIFVAFIKTEAKTPATMMIRAVIFATLVAMALGLETGESLQES